MIKTLGHFIGIDLGGTAIKIGRYDLKGKSFAEAEFLTPKPSMPGAVTVALCEAVDFIDPDKKAKNIGICLPGPMDSKGRVARVCINLPGWIDVPLADCGPRRLAQPLP